MAIGMQGIGMGGNWLMGPYNGWGGGGFGQMPQSPMQPPAFGGGMGGFGAMPQTPMQPPAFGSGGGFSPMPGGFGASPGGMMGGMPGGGRSPAGGGMPMSPGGSAGFGGMPRPSMPGVGPGLQMGSPSGGMGQDVRNAISPGIRWKGDTRGQQPSLPQPPQQAGGSGSSSQGMDVSGFSQNIRGFDGQNYSNPGDYWNKVGAFVNNINEDRSQLSAQSGQRSGPPPARDLGGAWDRAGEMVKGGWQNPFGQAQPVMPAQQQGGFPPVPQAKRDDGWGQGMGWRSDQRPPSPPSGSPSNQPAGGAYSAYGGGYGAMGGPSGGRPSMPTVTDSRPKDPRTRSFNPDSPTWNNPANAAARDRYNSDLQFYDNWSGSTDATLSKLRGQSPQGKWLGFR